MTLGKSIDGEVTVAEILTILNRKRSLIAACLFISVLAGIIYSWLQKPVFEASATLRLGQVYVGEPIQLESSSALIMRLSNDSNGSTFATVARGDNNLITITSRSNSRDEAASSIERAIQSVIDSHTKAYQQSTQPIQNRIEQIVSQRQALERQSAALKTLIEQLRTKEPVQASILMMQNSLSAATVLKLDQEYLELLQQLAPPQTRNTEQLGKIVAPALPVQPKKWQAVALFGAIGLLIGILIALGIEFLVVRKQWPAEP